MKLSYAVNMRLEESQMFIDPMPLLEDGEGPRWKFRYDNWDTDPSPDILLLGSYRHPNTNNNLVGGINLHYLNNEQMGRLAQALPKIIQAGNLQRRYWAGRSLLPDVFTDFYRTYDSKYIRGVEQGVLYPKYGFLKATQNWIKKKVKNLFKPKKEVEQDAELQYPDDLQQIHTRLDDVVTQLQRRDQEDAVGMNTPEMDVARKEFDRNRKRQNKNDIIDVDDEILKRNMDDFIDKQTTQQRRRPTESEPRLTPKQISEPEFQEPEFQEPKQSTPRPADRAKSIRKNREENQKELLEPENEVNREIDLEESIIYYSPVKNRYIIEKISKYEPYEESYV